MRYRTQKESYADNSRTTKTIKKEVGKIGLIDRIFNANKTLTHTLWACDTGKRAPPARFDAHSR
jgi:hypothetical protein